ncbi:hypothetical protein [Botrimarina mediterranea]|uniref:Cytochrome c domain-containing protein n=1 Tax=Botrimarina mediterranea TaxID=2528022 RepID=A0A518K4A4_9BACT|nr:hypothetical protein [Botrimarina mediterranea]QDV72626.1 hypothetical protein Spa11_08060 [Botrimarina mediterranea]QDV77198.1 hypothetical protein K2D_07870 [Planctomycetes bacterium K2D]
MHSIKLSFLTVLVLAVAAQQPAMAHPEYQREFQNVYTKKPGVEKDFKNLVRSAKCYICHQGKEDRKNYNCYGKALTAHLVEADKKNKKKIAKALETVAAEPSNGEGSPTFGDLIAKGELPGGPLEESKKEPAGG